MSQEEEEKVVSLVDTMNKLFLANDLDEHFYHLEYVEFVDDWIDTIMNPVLTKDYIATITKNFVQSLKEERELAYYGY